MRDLLFVLGIFVLVGLGFRWAAGDFDWWPEWVGCLAFALMAEWVRPRPTLERPLPHGYGGPGRGRRRC